MKLNWLNEKLCKPKLRTYNVFKQIWGTEKYLSFSLTPFERSTIAKLRLGILPLAVETGRYNNIPLEDRICALCDLNEVETEYHFVFVCTRYNELRENLLNMAHFDRNWFLSLNLTDKFNFLFEKPKLFSQYLLKCLELRQSVLYT